MSGCTRAFIATSARLVVAVIVLATAACQSAPAPDAHALVNDFAAWMGGTDPIRRVQSLILQGEGERTVIGQGAKPFWDDPLWKITTRTRRLDLAGRRLRVRETREAAPVCVPPAQPADYGLDGQVAYDATAGGTLVRVSARAARRRHIEWLHHPVVLMQAALAPEARLVYRGVSGGHQIVELTTPDGDVVSLGFDRAYGVLSVARSASDDPLLGDVTIESAFWEYRDIGGLRLPMRIVSRLDQYPEDDFRISTVALDADVSGAGAPQDIHRAPVPPAEQPPRVTVEELAPGVWRLAGETHHSVAVEFDDHFAIIDVPMSEARTQAVIRATRALRPGKPVALAIVTHPHFDHIGGLRAAVSEGLAIIAHRNAEGILRDLVGRSHSREPDALQRNPRPMDLQLVDANVYPRFQFRDATGELRVAFMERNSHTSAMLGAFLPRARMFVQADLFSSEGGTSSTAPLVWEQTRHEIQEWQDDLRRASPARRLGRFPETPILQVPLHGTPVPEPDLLEAISR